MNRNWTIGICLTLLLIGGFAVNAIAQQPSTAPAPAPAAPADPKAQAPDGSKAPDSSTSQPAQPSAPQMQQAPPTTPQTVQEPARFLGVDPTVAMLLGAALLIVIVFALVAMSRRRDEIRRDKIEHTHTRV